MQFNDEFYLNEIEKYIGKKLNKLNLNLDSLIQSKSSNVDEYYLKKGVIWKQDSIQGLILPLNCQKLLKIFQTINDKHSIDSKDILPNLKFLHFHNAQRGWKKSWDFSEIIELPDLYG